MGSRRAENLGSDGTGKIAEKINDGRSFHGRIGGFDEVATEEIEDETATRDGGMGGREKEISGFWWIRVRARICQWRQEERVGRISFLGE